MFFQRLFDSYPRAAHYILLLLIGGITLLAGNDTLPLIDRDEPRFTQATREMIQREEWIIPYFNGEYRFDKPVMTYWLMRAAFFLLGSDGEFPARLPAATAALLVALLLYEIGRRGFDGKTGLAAAVGWLTCLQVLIHGRMAVADMPLILAMTLSHGALWALLKGYDRRWFRVFYGSLAFGFLVKGPLAFLVPLLTLLLFRWVFWRRPLPWGNLKPHRGLPLAVLLVGIWGIPALLETGGLFWDKGIGKHVVERGMTPLNGRGFSVFYYLPSSLVSLFPATAFLGGIWAVVRRRWNEKQAFLVSWILGPYLIFSFYATQLPHYVLPAYPAVFLLLGQSLNPDPADYPRLRKSIFYATAGVGLLIGMILTGLALTETVTPETLPLQKLALCFAGLVLSLTLMAGFAYFRLWSGLTIPVIGIGVCVGFGSAYLREYAPAIRLMPVFQAMPAETRYFFSGFEEPSLIYYSNRHWDKLPDAPERRRLLEQPGPKLLVLLKREKRLESYLAARFPSVFPPGRTKSRQNAESLTQDLRALGYRSATAAGVNTAHISWVEVEAWYRPR
jgi:4-amino-4-deoxy-L-arabinose transferase-like glycosyltransferase